MLNPGVEGKLKGGLSVFQLAVELALDAHLSLGIDVGVTEHMARQLPRRVDSAFFILEFEARNTKAVYVILLAWRQMPPYPDKIGTVTEPRSCFAFIQVGKDTDQSGGRFTGIGDHTGVGEKRGGLQAGGQQYAVAVDNIGAADLVNDRPRSFCQMGCFFFSQHGDVNQPDGNNGESRGKQRTGYKQPGAAKFDVSGDREVTDASAGKKRMAAGHCTRRYVARKGRP